MAKICWDSGTAYDFFISLFVLHNPDRFGLRPQWAAGVRARIPEPHRQFLENCFDFLPIPLVWINRLDVKPKTSSTLLLELAKIPPAERLLIFFQPSQLTRDILETFENIRSSGIVTSKDIEKLRIIYQRRPVPIKTSALQKLSDALRSPEAFGRDLLSALESYNAVFFAEEEERIAPCIEKGLSKSQQLAEKLSTKDLMEELSNGISFEPVDLVEQVWLIPSYWSTPLTVIKFPDPQETLMAFGCRQKNQNLIPGEYVPEELVTSLKALSDSSRLRILHYLNIAPETPAGLARKMRLRPPTIIHHLNILRLAKLVQIDIAASGERRYSLREAAVLSHLSQIKGYILAAD